MQYSRNSQRASSGEKYTKAQVEAVLKGLGLNIISETYSDFLMFCPFHGNRDTPSFSVGLETGLYICFNPACQETGNLIHLVKYASQRNDFEAVRFIQGKGGDTADNFEQLLADAVGKPPTFEPWQPETLKKLRESMTSDSKGMKYMLNRGFTEETVEYFEVGYSAAQNMVAVPVHSPNGIPVGIVGRSVEGKEFKNSKKLPRNKTLFNVHRAKRAGDIVIVTEASFDAMRVHQAGFPNVVATLGGHMSPENYAILDRSFNMVIIMTDDDDPSKHVYKNCRKCHPQPCLGHNPGKELGLAIASTLRNKNILWASYDYGVRYAGGVKDAGDMTDEQISQCINNAVSHLEFLGWS